VKNPKAKASTGFEDGATFSSKTTMCAIGMTRFPEIGEVAETLEMLVLSVPRPKKGEVVVKIAASAMHIDEIYAAQGTALGRFYGPKNVSIENPARLGSCATGKVVALGEGAQTFELGQNVIIIPSEHPQAGSWATYQCFEEKWLLAKPVTLTHVEAAAVTMAACVGWGAIGFSKAKPGDHCVVVGASGAIGVMVLQFLKTLGCRVTAVCSGKSAKFVRGYGADDVVDYTISDFADVIIAQDGACDVVFDCVGGRDIEQSAFRCLKKSGVFETVVGPRRYIGEKLLSWPKVIGVMGYIVWRMLVTRLRRGPKYTFGEKYPRLVIRDALAQVIKHDIRMPTPSVIPFEVEAIRDAVRKLQTHREKGRTVIDFSLPQ
jgi:reticulon-4-interacting protein 1, mitochondrial